MQGDVVSRGWFTRVIGRHDNRRTTCQRERWYTEKSRKKNKAVAKQDRFCCALIPRLSQIRRGSRRCDCTGSKMLKISFANGILLWRQEDRVIIQAAYMFGRGREEDGRTSPS